MVRAARGDRRLRIPHSILLVLTGLVLALIPGLPKVPLDPEVVLLLCLPPLPYNAGVSMSWRGFRDNLGSIALQAVGCVPFTTIAVAGRRAGAGGGGGLSCGAAIRSLRRRSNNNPAAR